MADIAVQSSFPGTVGTVTRSDDARRTNAVLPFIFTTWKDTTDARLVNRSFLIAGTPQQGRNKAVAVRLDQALGELLFTKTVVTPGFSHPDIFAPTQELSLIGHIFP